MHFSLYYKFAESNTQVIITYPRQISGLFYINSLEDSRFEINQVYGSGGMNKSRLFFKEG